jgi:hypothetical protein
MYERADSYFSRHSQEVRRAIVLPEELPRLQTPRRDLHRDVDLLREFAPSIPSESPHKSEDIWHTLKILHFGLLTIEEHELKKFPPIQ